MSEIMNNLNLPKEIAQNDLFFVGGASRSIILHGALPTDVDICGNFDVGEFKDLNLDSKQYIKQLHSLRFKSGKYDVDITAFRNEEYKKGYFPSKVIRVDTPYQDSFRRDFTINSIYINKNGEIFDYHNGIEHLNDKKIVQISDDTLKVDGMRIYRMIRFALTLGFEIDKSTLNSAVENVDNVFQIQKSRAMVEYNKFKQFITKDNIGILRKLQIFQHLEINC
ncbi:MAG: hypothetical protein R3Y32_01555 [Bacillota bacterium]